MDKFSSVSEFSSVSKSVSKGGYKKTKLVSKFHSAPAHVRVRKGANARNERLNAAMLSLDRLLDGRDPAKDPLLGDRGEGAARMYRTLDGERGTSDADGANLTNLTRRKRRALRNAESRLRAAGRGNLVRVLELICANGSNRRESIATLQNDHRKKILSCRNSAKRMYYKKRTALLAFFCGHSTAHGYIGGDANAACAAAQGHRN